jgi:hypothetical protein
MGVRANIFEGKFAATVVLLGSLGAMPAAARGELAFQFAGTLTASGPGNDAFFFTVGSLDLLVTKLGEYSEPTAGARRGRRSTSSCLAVSRTVGIGSTRPRSGTSMRAHRSSSRSTSPSSAPMDR